MDSAGTQAFTIHAWNDKSSLENLTSLRGTKDTKTGITQRKLSNITLQSPTSQLVSPIHKIFRPYP